MNPKISIIIPTFNRESYLKQTIQSALDQDYDNYEVIVSDNASTDNTEEMVKEFLTDERFRYYKNETNIGMVKNWHKALYNYIEGEWFLILSDDDYFIDNTYLRKAVELMSKDEEIAIVYANGYIKHEDTGEMVPLELPFDEINEGKKIFLSRGKVRPQDFTLCNILFHKEKALTFEPFENEFNISCDSELFLQMCVYTKVGVVKDFASVYRVHSSNLIKDVSKSWDIFLNNHDYIFIPFQSAKESGRFLQEEINSFERRFILPSLRSSLLSVKLFFPHRYLDFIDYLTQKDESLVEKLLQYTQYDLKIKLAAIPGIFKLKKLLTGKI